jgi:cytochrome c oxidase subunit IV
MQNYEEGIAVVKKGLGLLAAITLIEVAIALLGNGHIIEGFHLSKWIMYPLMIGFSLYKAYFIVYYFMHMAHEVKGLAMSVLLPCLLLVWAVIAFFNEGNSWHTRRDLIQKKNELQNPLV